VNSQAEIDAGATRARSRVGFGELLANSCRLPRDPPVITWDATESAGAPGGAAGIGGAGGTFGTVGDLQTAADRGIGETLAAGLPILRRRSLREGPEVGPVAAARSSVTSHS
jgi:hypothetical protein